MNVVPKLFLGVCFIVNCGGGATLVVTPPSGGNNDDVDAFVPAPEVQTRVDTTTPPVEPDTFTEPLPDAGKPEECVIDIGGANKKRIGHLCTSHNDCETCYCYDEAYMGADQPGAFRFCTLPCGSGVGGDCANFSNPGESHEYECVLFLTQHIKDYKLTKNGICMPTCQDVGECKIYAENYGYCPPKGQGTKWSDGIIQIASTCQTTNQE